MRRLVLFAAVFLFCGCATVDFEGPQVKPIGLSLDEARQVVASFEAKQSELTAGNPLKAPKSLDDVLEILKLDQLDLFGPGVAFAAKQDDMKALTLRAQIELAWGEAQMILAEIFSQTAKYLGTTLRSLEAKDAAGALSDSDREKLDKLRKEAGQAKIVSDALARLATEHVAEGAKHAKTVMEKNPSDYQGYRLAADFYRLRQDWQSFDEMVKKIEETNPQSNGLLFLKGVSAANREGDASKANEFYRKALSNDPKFTRAQVQVVLLQNGIKDTYTEFKALKALNPNHQIVVWAGELIESAWEREQQRRQQVKDVIQRKGQ
jgi:tetratricopeptide (TPR) repeat protein